MSYGTANQASGRFGKLAETAGDSRKMKKPPERWLFVFQFLWMEVDLFPV
jgi:hypothetical protein